jgi:FdhE protein
MANLRPGHAVRTAPFLSDEARSAIHQKAGRTPDWAPWLRLLESALGEADAGAWEKVELEFPSRRPAPAPLLDGAKILVDAGAAARSWAALTAIVDAPSSIPAGDAVALLDAGISQDPGRLAALEDRVTLDAAVLGTVTQFHALPLLLEAARRAVPALTPAWRQGYCPVCGGWPVLVELRGLERRRVLRCCRCATGWERDVLHCPFCDERDHRSQGALVPEQGGERVRVETCGSCRGYLKAFTTLRSKPVWALFLEDLETLPLELKAVDRGFSRPQRPGWPLTTTLTARTDRT